MRQDTQLEWLFLCVRLTTQRLHCRNLPTMSANNDVKHLVPTWYNMWLSEMPTTNQKANWRMMCASIMRVNSRCCLVLDSCPPSVQNANSGWKSNHRFPWLSFFYLNTKMMQYRSFSMRKGCLMPMLLCFCFHSETVVHCITPVAQMSGG